MSASVVIKQSIVAMLGCIIPDPFATPPIFTSFPAILKLYAASFFTVSVVIIACAKSSEPVYESSLTALGTPSSKVSNFKGSPITPVELTKTSSFFISKTSASNLHVFSATSIPFTAHVFAFPLLHITALIFPSFICSLSTAIGAPLTLFCVKTAATLHSLSLTIIPKSFLSLFFLKPQCIPDAIYPFGAHMPPPILLISISVSFHIQHIQHL